MKKQKQLVIGNEFKTQKEFGGAHLNKSHAKKARPIAIKKTMHLTLRSSKAKGDQSFRASKSRIQRIDKVIKTQGKKFAVEIYRVAIVGNHIHMLVKAGFRKGFISFLRAISGIIARIALGAERGSAKLSQSSSDAFWDQRPWTRILFTWTEFKNVKKYVELNFNEAAGFVAYKPRIYKSTA